MKLNFEKLKLFPMSIGAMMIMFSKDTVTLNVNTKQMILGICFIIYGLIPSLKKR